MGVRELIKKYSTAGPRYTSYPTAPHWNESVGQAQYAQKLKAAAATGDPLALYVHIPFCEQLCYYCGCNILITKESTRGLSYVESLLTEMREVAKTLGRRVALSQISWGGGTPTFLGPDSIRKLQNGTRELFDLTEDAEVSIEIDPRVTSDRQLETLRELGFNRASLGVQDFNPEVQKAINRIQSFESTAGMLKRCHELGFRGVNFDLIYGLPFQTLATFTETVSQVVEARPDRIALYNYAHLPSLRPHQKILEKYPMAGADERVDIFSRAYETLLGAGYHSIGMDHFALATDELTQALQDGRLYRNFMGYTVKKGAGLIGVGASAIGEVGQAYFQNIREAKEYQEKIAAGDWATLRGCLLTPDDRERKWVIQSLMCRFRLDSAEFAQEFGRELDAAFPEEMGKLGSFFDEGLLEGNRQSARVTDLGRLFCRNVAMVFDAYLSRPSQAVYSRTV